MPVTYTITRRDQRSLTATGGSVTFTVSVGPRGPNLITDATALGTLTGITDPAFLLVGNAAGTFARKLAHPSPSPAGSFTLASLTIDAFGRVTAASNGTVTAASITDSTAVGRAVLTAADAAAARSAIGAGVGNALTSGTLGQFAATTSAELAGVLTDETGSGGGFVRATGPTLSGTVTVNTGAAGTVGLSVDAAASQTAAPARVRDSAGNVVFQIVPSAGSTAANAPWLMVIGNAVGARSLAFDTSEGAIAVRDSAGNSLTNFVAATIRGRSGVAADTFVSVGNVELSAAGWRGDRVGLGNATQVVWSNSASGTGTAVLGLARLDDNTVEVNNGTRTASGGALRGLSAATVRASAGMTLTGGDWTRSFNSDLMTGSYLLRRNNDGTPHNRLVGMEAAQVVLSLRGAASQTGNLLQCENNAGTSVASVSAGGNIATSGVVFVGTYTVGTLPSASANAGAFAQVTDSNSTTNGGTVAGGGANRVPVFSNGTNWIIK